MRCTDQMALAAFEELAGRPVQSTASMRTDVQPRTYGVTLPVEHHRFSHTVHHGFNFSEATILY